MPPSRARSPPVSGRAAVKRTSGSRQERRSRVTSGGIPSRPRTPRSFVMTIPHLLADLGTGAYDRHGNILSWYVRPLFLLPLAWFAYRRSGWGVAATLVALATSMFWFPAPAEPDPRVLEFLQF